MKNRRNPIHRVLGSKTYAKAIDHNVKNISESNKKLIDVKDDVEKIRYNLRV